jgi:hypothetical protein
MAVFRHFGSKEAQNQAPGQTGSCLHDASLNELAAQVRMLTASIDSLQRAFSALNAFRVALEAKTWIAFHQRRSGRVAGGCARAATARRDARGRYLPGDET